MGYEISPAKRHQIKPAHCRQTRPTTAAAGVAHAPPWRPTSRRHATVLATLLPCSKTLAQHVTRAVPTAAKRAAVTRTPTLLVFVLLLLSLLLLVLLALPT